MNITAEDRTVTDGILNAWFGVPGSPTFGHDRSEWWQQSDTFDAVVSEVLLPHYEKAASGKLDHWADDASGGLALVLLLDQVPRNMFRGQAQAFATDSKAREIAGGYIASGLDPLLAPVQRLFIYLPFEHSETLADQDRAVVLISALGIKSMTEFAWRHREIIDRFGRFPHRNEILGRPSSNAEKAFLKQPNSSF